MPSLFRSFLLWAALSLASRLSATNYYVDDDDGSDSNNGQSATLTSSGHGPFLTFAHAIPLLNPGDTLTAAPGNYTETRDINAVQHGSGTSVITIQAANASNPPRIIERQGSNANAPASSFKILTSNVHLSGINVTGGVYGIYVGPGQSSITIDHCAFSAAYQAGVMLDGKAGAPIQNVSVQNCTVANCGQINLDRSGARDWPHAILGIYASGVSITNCVVHDNSGEGLGPFTGCQDWTISDNTVYDNYSVNIYLDTNVGGMLVQRNFVYCTYKYDTTNARNRPDGIRIANETANTASPPPAPSNYMLINNIICGGDSGIRCSSYGSAYVGQGISQGVIANNTIISQTAQPDSHGIWFGYDGAPNQGVSIINNVACSAASTWASLDLGGRGLIASNNYNGGSPNFVNADVNWTASTPPLAASYQLTASSPCVDAGTATNAPATDYAEKSRDAKPDIGAYEYMARQP